MKQIVSILAVAVLAIASGCATTQADTSGGAKKESVLAATRAPQCVPGYNACVCDKESRCCSMKTDCECSSGGQAMCK